MWRGWGKLSINWLCGGLLSFLVTVFHIVRIQALDLIQPKLDPFQLVSCMKQMESVGSLPKI